MGFVKKLPDRLRFSNEQTEEELKKESNESGLKFSCDKSSLVSEACLLRNLLNTCSLILSFIRPTILLCKRNAFRVIRWFFGKLVSKM